MFILLFFFLFSTGRVMWQWVWVCDLVVFWWLGAAVVGSDDSGSCHCCNCGSG